MKVLLDGVEIPWPRKIEIHVDVAGETVGPLQIDILGGVLKMCSIADESALTVTAFYPAGLELEGPRFDPPTPILVTEKGTDADEPNIIEAGRADGTAADRGNRSI